MSGRVYAESSLGTLLRNILVYYIKIRKYYIKRNILQEISILVLSYGLCFVVVARHTKTD